MASRQLLEEYGAANNGIVAMAQKDLVDFWKLLDTTNPLGVKAAMLEFMPELISAYGESAAVLAADFYDSVRPAGLPPFKTVMADLPPVEQIEAVTRHNIDPVFKGEPDAALSKLASSVQRLVNQPARDTIARNADHDPSGVLWARVPMGKTTCSFCRMLASRGAAYGSKALASAKHNGRKYHDDCDCKPVPMWSKADFPEGYDPDELYDEYRAAHEPGMSTKETLAAMRKQDGEFVTAIAAPIEPVAQPKVATKPEPAPRPAPKPTPEPVPERAPVVPAVEPVVIVEVPKGPRKFSTAKEANDWGAARMLDVKALPKDDFDEIKRYSGAGAYGTNRALRSGTFTGSNGAVQKQMIGSLDRAMKQSVVPEDVVVVRALGADAFAATLAKAKKPDLSGLVGSVFKDDGYLSTALADKPATGFGKMQVTMEIVVPKGTNALWVGKASQLKTERELLLDRGTELAIQSATQNARTGKWTIKATVVPKQKKK